jgi:pantothenate kinase
MNIEQLAKCVRDKQIGTNRVLVAIVGAPASGKSTLSENLQNELGGEKAGCAIVPMDGFHFDDGLLKERNLLERKGAPNTFDVGGLKRTLTALREDNGEDVYVPVFDRDLEISRGSARAISRHHRIILVEGNYLLLNQAPWDQLKELFDLTIYLEVPEETLRERLITRWIDHGFDRETALKKAMTNDLPNAQTVSRYTAPADVNVSST